MPLAATESAPDKGHVLVVDDAEPTRALITGLLERDGHRVSCVEDERDLAEHMRIMSPDLVLLDVMLPHVSGFDICRNLKSSEATYLTPVVLVTGLDDHESRVKGIEAGADDFVTKPFNIVELRARVRSLIRIKRYTDDLDSAEAAFVSLALTIEARDPLTNGHCHRLAKYAAELGARIGLARDDLTTLTRGALLHDIGKVGVADAILLKPGSLSRDEYRTMQEHTVIGDRVCAQLRSLQRVRPIIRHHHERLDGSGYPDGLRGDDIPLAAQIIGVVDVFDALTAERPYRSAQPVDQALDELRREVQRGWRRADLVETWIDFVSRGANGDTR